VRQQISPEKRLAILRALDSGRKWYSLDDEMICTVCHRIFKGRQIAIDGDGHGAYSLQCPTPGCPATIRSWFLCGVSPYRYDGAKQKPEIREFSFLDSALSSPE
jgi:hypothetical protein